MAEFGGWRSPPEAETRVPTSQGKLEMSGNLCGKGNSEEMILDHADCIYL